MKLIGNQLYTPVQEKWLKAFLEKYFRCTFDEHDELVIRYQNWCKKHDLTVTNLDDMVKLFEVE